jgi:hypothetical protein
MKVICKVGEIWKKNQHPRYISQNLKARAKKIHKMEITLNSNKSAIHWDNQQ